MKNWSVYKDLLARHHRHPPFTSNLFNILNKKLTIVSTRNHFNLETGQLSLSHNIEDYDSYNVPGLNGNLSSDNKELAVYIHGVWTGQVAAKEQTDRINLSLISNEYSLPVVGFSWDSNTVINPSGWNIAKSIAKQNGPKLAKFLSDFRTNCPNHKIRLIAHSLGAKVVESALIRLNNNEPWKNNSSYNITSVHLIGAAISDRAPSKNTQFGIAIDNTVNNFYNLYNPKDNLLLSAYIKTENENPLGLFGLNKAEPFPINYTEQNVMLEIPPFRKASGIYKPFIDNRVSEWGNNHSGYIGFRDVNGKLKNDGAIKVIVADWKTTNNR
jgi:pimeloyl-ACP methyl ester carboxylesterase